MSDREAFEASIRKRYPRISLERVKDEDDYCHSTVSIAWRSWQAAIASMQGDGTLVAEIKSRAGDYHYIHWHTLLQQLPVGTKLFTYPPDAAEIARLTKELEEARKDAERYRMMRSLDVTPYEKWNKAQKALHRAMNSADTVEMVDAAVDAALIKIGVGE